MKLDSAQIEKALTQFNADVLPDDHPLVQKLSELFGDHTFFLDGTGLNIIEPDQSIHSDVPAGTVVNLASWSDAEATRLAPHEPERTNFVIMLESKH
jgi:hypothetical protein